MAAVTASIVSTSYPVIRAEFAARAAEPRRSWNPRNPLPSVTKNRETTSRRFHNEINKGETRLSLHERTGPTYVKPKGGAPKGNTNALKHGQYSADAQARRAKVQTLLRSTRELIERLEALRVLHVALGLPTRTIEYVTIRITRTDNGWSGVRRCNSVIADASPEQSNRCRKPARRTRPKRSQSPVQVRESAAPAHSVRVLWGHRRRHGHG